MVKKVFSRALLFYALLALMPDAHANCKLSNSEFGFVISEFGTASIINKHQILLSADSELKPVYAATVNFADFGGTAQTLDFFNSKIKNNHVRFEIIEEKSLLLIYLSDYASSPKSVAEWNAYFKTKSSNLR